MERFLKQHQKFKLGPWVEPLTRIISEKREFLDTARGNFQRFKYLV